MDLVLLGGNVLAMDTRNTRAEAVAVDKGRIVAVGANAEIATCVGPETRVIHLGGRTLLPGFIDPHNHFSLTTFAPVSVDCRVPPHRSLPHVLEAIAAAYPAPARGRFRRGSNGFQDMWQTPVWGHTTVDGHRGKRGEENRAMTRWELDEAA